jgi:hypothetical protein
VGSRGAVSRSCCLSGSGTTLAAWELGVGSVNSSEPPGAEHSTGRDQLDFPEALLEPLLTATQKCHHFSLQATRTLLALSFWDWSKLKTCSWSDMFLSAPKPHKGGHSAGQTRKPTRKGMLCPWQSHHSGEIPGEGQEGFPTDPQFQRCSNHGRHMPNSCGRREQVSGPFL